MTLKRCQCPQSPHPCQHDRSQGPCQPGALVKPCGWMLAPQSPCPRHMEHGAWLGARLEMLWARGEVARHPMKVGTPPRAPSRAVGIGLCLPGPLGLGEQGWGCVGRRHTNESLPLGAGSGGPTAKTSAGSTHRTFQKPQRLELREASNSAVSKSHFYKEHSLWALRVRSDVIGDHQQTGQ